MDARHLEPGSRPVGRRATAAGPADSQTATTTLYLVDPAGGRYAITTFPPPGEQASPELVDWSGDGSHALFDAQYAKPPMAIMVDLHTGRQTTLTLQGSPRYSRPEGKALLLSTPPGPGSRLAALDRVDLAGNHQLTYPTDKLGSPFNGNYLSTPDGTQLVLGTSAGLVLMGNDGTPASDFADPGSDQLQPVAVVGRIPHDRSRGLRRSRIYVAPVVGADRQRPAYRSHRSQ